MTTNPLFVRKAMNYNMRFTIYVISADHDAMYSNTSITDLPVTQS